MTMVEKVARASFACWNEDNGTDFVFEDMPPSELEFSFKHAAACIEAMREPTEEMKGEGYHPNCHMCGGHLEGWQRMIDAALKTS